MIDFPNAYVLTGSIATGKSTAGAILKLNGLKVVDGDSIAHYILDSSKNEIIDAFGYDIIRNNKIDRKILGKIIFNSKEERLKLDNILHHKIYAKIIQEAQSLEKFNKPYILDIPLFYERGDYPFQKVIVVYTPKEIQVDRLSKRDNITHSQALKKIKTNIDIETKKTKADFVIDNSQNLKNLQNECDKIFRLITNA
jgi:dephospho-CoA kinase